MAKIVVIEDELVLLDLVADFLRKDGHEVTAISNPLAAVELVAGNLAAIDLIVTDISMRPISGIEAVKRIIEGGWKGSVLFISGYYTASTATGELLGQHSMVAKPFTGSELRSAVAKVLGRIPKPA